MALILASQSPRRRDLLQQIGITDFRVIPSTCDEKQNPTLSPALLVQQLSLQKALDVATQVAPEDIVIAADTIVVLDNTVLGKPRDAADAVRMLSSLSGRHHQVMTGVTVLQGEHILTRHEETDVFFKPLTPEEIDWYVATGEPLDKAGAYGIQGAGARFIPRIQGDYSNVVGLPLCLLTDMLQNFA